MPHSNTVLSQLLQVLPRHEFESIVFREDGDRYVKHFSCWNQLSVMLYAQGSHKQSLRDIEVGLAAQGEKLYHLGIERVRRSTLADANSTRPSAMYEKHYYPVN